jgi:hypothetical protein
LWRANSRSTPEGSALRLFIDETPLRRSDFSQPGDLSAQVRLSAIQASTLKGDGETRGLKKYRLFTHIQAPATLKIFGPKSAAIASRAR